MVPNLAHVVWDASGVFGWKKLRNESHFQQEQYWLFGSWDHTIKIYGSSVIDLIEKRKPKLEKLPKYKYIIFLKEHVG